MLLEGVHVFPIKETDVSVTLMRLLEGKEASIAAELLLYYYSCNCSYYYCNTVPK